MRTSTVRGHRVLAENFAGCPQQLANHYPGPEPGQGGDVAETHLGTEQLMDTGEPPTVAWAVTAAEPLPGSRVKTN